MSHCSSPSGGGKPELTGTVTIDNTSPEVGDTLAASYEGNGTGNPAWQWLAGGTSIPGANSKTYTVTASDLDKTLTARVSFADQDGAITSEPTTTVRETLITNSIEDITELLSSNTGTRSNPLSLKVVIDIGLPSDPESGWRKLLAALFEAGDYVALDLSDCTMTGNIFDYNNEPRVPGMDKIVEISLPDVVVTIGERVFYYCSSLTKVSVPEATSIGYEAFSNCSSLTEVDIPEVISIGNGAFYYCFSLAEVSFPKVTSVGVTAFYVCRSLTKVSIPKATSIGNGAFHDCISLIEVSFPEATSIGWGTFSGCISLTEVSFPKATSIGWGTFSGCISLTEVSFPKATYIGNWVFDRCTRLRTITLGVTAPTVDYQIFYNVSGNPTVTVKIPAGATGYDKPGTFFPQIYNESSNHTVNWANGFRGKGWNGTGFTNTGAATPVTLRIEYQ